jgi:hypothetical protein
MVRAPTGSEAPNDQRADPPRKRPEAGDDPRRRSLLAWLELPQRIRNP